jgi:tetratricopeptide (TPR) repeat protein
MRSRLHAPLRLPAPAAASPTLRPVMMATRCSPLFRIPSPSPPPSSNARAAHHVTRALPASAPVDALQLALDPAAVQLYDVAEGLETPIQLLYLVTLLAFLSAAAFLVVRQALIRRELDESAKGLGERIRTGEATCEDYFELGVVLTRKRLFTQATKNLEKAKKVWDGEESELAQVHNALGYCYLNMEQVDASVAEFKRAVQLQPGYVTAWNNLGDAYERTKSWRSALSAYQEALSYAPANDIARVRTDYCKTRCERLNL